MLHVEEKQGVELQRQGTLEPPGIQTQGSEDLPGSAAGCIGAHRLY